MQKTWTVAEARAHLSEVLRLAEEEGPQTIGVQARFVVVPEALWRNRETEPSMLGAWLADNAPRGEPLPLPDRSDDRPVLFAADGAE